MRIGILGSGALAVGLGTAWARAGHEVLVGGRSLRRSREAADRMGGGAAAVIPADAVAGREAVLLAVSWPGVREMLETAGADRGTLEGTPLIDPTNPVDHGVGVLRLPDGTAMAEQVARWAPGARVVKAFHLFAADQWGVAGRDPVTVAMAGDDDSALRTVGELVEAAGGRPAVLGPLSRARQLEEVAGFVIGLAFAGHDPSAAIPHLSLDQASR